MRITDDYVFFWGGPFSQWAHSPFTIGQQTFNCAEQWMMYMKAVTFGDLETAAKIMADERPSEQKKLGRAIQGYEDDIWATTRYHVVVAGSLAKFNQNPEMLEVLKSTEDRIIVEASPYDDIWGVALGENDPLIDNPLNWKGTNLLGMVLMNIRDR